MEDGLKLLKDGISSAIITMRKQSIMSQIQLSKASGLSQSVISRMERGCCDSIKNLFLVCDSMGMDIVITFSEKEKVETNEPADMVRDSAKS